MEDQTGQFEKLVADLKSPVRLRQRAAIIGLVDSADPRAIEPLITALDDPNKDITRFIASALGEFGEPAFLKVLPLLKSESSRQRELAALTLGEFRSLAVEPLLEALAVPGETTAVREELVYSLGITEDARAEAPMAHILLNDSSSTVRAAVALILYKVAGENANGPLIKALTDSDEKVKQKAAESLGDLGVQEAYEPLLKLLADPVDKVRETAVNSLREIGNREAAKPILGLLTDNSPGVRGVAVWALGELQAHEVIEQVAGLLTDSDERVSFWAAWSLAMLGDERGFAPMLTGLSSSENWHRYRAAESLGTLGNRAALPALMQVELNRSNIAREVIGAVTKIGTKEEAGKYLIGLLRQKSTYTSIRNMMIKALGEIGFAEALPELRALVEEEAPTGQKAREAILKIEAVRE